MGHLAAWCGPEPERERDMNDRTLAHLNFLRLMTSPVSYSAGAQNGPCVFLTQLDKNQLFETDAQKALLRELTRQAHAVVLRHYPVALAEEIRAAASECRKAMASPCDSLHWWPKNGNLAGIRALELARAEIELLIQHDNARRAAEYEAYRVACAQGVAVPPPELPAPIEDDEDDEEDAA